MNIDRENRRNAPTRRRYIGTAGALLGGGLFAGCTGGRGPSSNGTANGTGSNATGTARNGSYSVAMEPMGTVAFENVPDRWVPFTGDYADMGVALGQADGLTAVGVKARYGSHLYEQLPGVSVNEERLTELYQAGTGKEVFYELDADLHVIDPNFLVNRLEWSRGDVEEIAANVAPFFGNTIFTRVYDWHDYRNYSLYDAFEIVAEVFKQRARYEAFRRCHDEVLATIRDRMPGANPTVAVLYPADVPPESFYPYRIGPGTQSKQWTDLNARDALARHGIADAQAGGGTIDYETLLEVDPEVIAIRLQGEITQEYIDREITAPMREHSVGSQLEAVRNDRVIDGGLTYQGPIIHLFQLEAAAQGLYPDEFGSERLFDRERVANIIRGDG